MQYLIKNNLFLKFEKLKTFSLVSLDSGDFQVTTKIRSFLLP